MKSIVLLSGGLDSAVSLAWAQRNQFPILCLFFDYGQESAANERVSSKKMAEYFNVDLNIVEVPFLKDLTGDLTVCDDAEESASSTEEADIQPGPGHSHNGLHPNRNGFFLNIAAAYAENLDASIIVAGFSREEAGVFPDKCFKYVEAKDHTLKMSTLSKVKVVCPTQNLSKEEIVNLGSKLEIPFEFIWICNSAGGKMCGECEGCQGYIRALQHNGLEYIWDKKTDQHLNGEPLGERG